TGHCGEDRRGIQMTDAEVAQIGSEASRPGEIHALAELQPIGGGGEVHAAFPIPGGHGAAEMPPENATAGRMRPAVAFNARDLSLFRSLGLPPDFLPLEGDVG